MTVELTVKEQKELHRLLDSHFNEGELRDLCFNLDVDFENLPGMGKKDRARELVLHCRRYALTEALLTELMEMRPDLRVTVERLLLRKSLEVKQWLETDQDNIRIGLSFPTDMQVIHETVIPAFGRIVGLPAQGNYWVVGYVRTDIEYEQGGSDIDEEGYWKIDAIHLAATTHRFFLRIFTEPGNQVAESNEITIVRR